MRLTKAQSIVIEALKNGAVIGELSNKRNGRYELFVRKPNWFPVTSYHFEHPLEIKTLNKNTVFALLTLGLICQDNTIAERMLPFTRDCWYRLIITSKQKAVIKRLFEKQHKKYVANQPEQEKSDGEKSTEAAKRSKEGRSDSPETTNR